MPVPRQLRASRVAGARDSAIDPSPARTRPIGREQRPGPELIDARDVFHVKHRGGVFHVKHRGGARRFTIGWTGCVAKIQHIR